MQKRSSRFFVVLLHLVGVSHRLRTEGIVGVQPWPIVLEEIQLGSESASLLSSSWPIWMQDARDGACLGPTGEFVECGDATLWLVTPKRRPQHRKRPLQRLLSWLRRGFEEEALQDSLDDIIDVESPEEIDDSTTNSPIGWTFQVVDFEASTTDPPESVTTEAPSLISKSRRTRKRRKEPQQRSAAECLTVDTKTSSVNVEKCYRRGWTDTRRLTWDMTLDEQALQSRAVFSNQDNKDEPLCLWRGGGEGDTQDNNNKIRLDTCSISPETSEHPNGGYLVQFSLVRYRAVAAPTTMSSTSQTRKTKSRSPSKLSSKSSSVSSLLSRFDESLVSTDVDKTLENVSTVSVPSNIEVHMSPASSMDIAHTHANSPVHCHVHQLDLTSPKIKLAPPSSTMSANLQTPIRPQSRPIDKILLNANPLLLGRQAPENSKNKKSKSMDKLSLTGSKDGLSMYKKVGRIEVHPYLATAKNDIWTDPQTGLTYPTDLCRYLGHDPKEYGRQTLTGVGQYRKGFVIKVYGIAYYVSKNDVLADPALEAYAGFTADELRINPDFYHILRTMGSDEGRFDRTLMLKTNMQLSAEIMRSSLHADWKLLSDEAIETLMSSSLEPRPADEEMLRLIQSPDNPSRCSCSQVAPAEYQADPACCARGTELAFTWRKSGNLEVRLNGRVMDNFERPDIAEAIFYEYLRYDDPISTDLRERVVDGFPFLLAPLAQLKGISIGHHSQNTPSTNKVHQYNPVVKVLSSVAEGATSSAMALGNFAHQSMTGVVSSSAFAVRSAGEAAHNVAKELDRRRNLVSKRLATSLPMFQNWYTPETIVSEDWTEVNITPCDQQEMQVVRRDSFGRAFGYPLSRWFSDTYEVPDEIGPMKLHPTVDFSRKIYLALVHFYLLLLFIVSLPGSYTTRTKLISRRFDKNVLTSSKSLPLPISSASSSASISAAGAALAVYNKQSSLINKRCSRTATPSQSVAKRLPCERASFRAGRLYARTRQAFRTGSEMRTSSSDDSADDEEIVTPTSTPLRKKSLSYFL